MKPRHREIADVLMGMIASAILSGLTYQEATAAFKVAAELMAKVEADPNAPDDKLADFAAARIEQELATPGATA